MHFLNAGFRLHLKIGLFQLSQFLLTQMLRYDSGLFLASTFVINVKDQMLYLLWSYRILFSCQPTHGLQCKIIAHIH